MNRARLLMLCGVAIGLWAGPAFSAEPSGPEPNFTDPGVPSQGQWEPRSNRGRTSLFGELPRPAAAWESEPALPSVRTALAQTPAKSDPLVQPLKAVPDAGASGAASATPSLATPRSQLAPGTPASPFGPSAPRGMIVPDDEAYGDGSLGIGPAGNEYRPGRCGRPGGRPLDLYGDDDRASPGDCGPCRPLPILSLSGGVHGFKGPADQGRNGNFGFQEGVGWSSLIAGGGIGYQLGMNATESNFSGQQTSGALDGGERDQIFLTAGAFHRAVCGGLQWGVAYDYLRDGYLENFQLQQFRSEASYVFQKGGEFGFWGAFGIDSDAFQGGGVRATDVYAFFLRKTVESGGQGRLWTGWTPQGALVGGDLYIPLGMSFALENSFHYLIPQGNNVDDDPSGNQKHEAWSLAINLVWYMGRNPGVHQSPARPVLPVADNSYFLINTNP